MENEDEGDGEATLYTTSEYLEKSDESSPESEEEYLVRIPTGWKGHWFFFRLAGWWCANTIMVASVTSVVWPKQISAILNDKSKEDLYNGFIPSFGALVSLIITPIAGSLSDHSVHRLGRRKVFIVGGTLISLVFFILMAFLNSKSGFNSVWGLMILIMGFQFGQQWAGGPYAGLMPDLVPKRYYGLASGWLGLAIAFGDLVGALGAGFLVDAENFWPVYIYLIIISAPFILATVLGIKEIPRPPPRTPFSVRKLVRGMYLDPHEYRDFYWVFFTRFLMDMGVYSILPFFLYYFEDVTKVDEKEASMYASFAVAAIVVVSIPSTIIAGKLSDKLGRKLLVYFSTAIMAAAVGSLCIVSYNPSISVSLILAGVVGIGYGSYQAVDWALALDVLPPGADIAKDMGIWHLAFVLPQVIAPIISGAILQSVKETSIPGAYATLFGITALWFVLATIFVYPVRTVKHNATKGSMLIRDKATE